MSNSLKNHAKHTEESAYVTKSWKIDESDTPYAYSTSALMVARRTPDFLASMEKLQSLDSELYDEINSHMRIANVPAIATNKIIGEPQFHVYSCGDHFCYITTTLPHDISQSFPDYTANLCLDQLNGLKSHVDKCIEKKKSEKLSSVWVIADDMLCYQYFEDTEEGYERATNKLKDIVDHIMSNFFKSGRKDGFDSSHIPELKKIKTRLSDHDNLFEECDIKRLFY